MNESDQNLRGYEAGPDDYQLYKLGAIFTITALAGILLDVFLGISTGGDLNSLPMDAAGRFKEMNENLWLGIYHLDFLNIVNQLLLIPAYFAICRAHRRNYPAFSGLIFIVFLTGTLLFVAGNTALPMLDLSRKFRISTDSQERMQLLAAGEAMLVKGEHGGKGVFIGFLLPNLAGFFLSMLMFKGRIFTRLSAIFGIFGSVFLIFYLVLVTFLPAAKSMATAVAMPGGLLSIVWMILFTVGLFRLSRSV